MLSNISIEISHSTFIIYIVFFPTFPLFAYGMGITWMWVRTWIEDDIRSLQSPFICLTSSWIPSCVYYYLRFSVNKSWLYLISILFRYSLQDLQPHPDLDITTLVLGFSVIISSLLARSFVISLYFISSSFHFFFLFLSFFPSFFSSFFSPFLFPYIYHFLSSTRFSPVFLSPYLSFHFYFYFYPFSFFSLFFLSNIFRCFFYYYSHSLLFTSSWDLFIKHPTF